MNTQTIDATIAASTHPDIAKRTSASNLILSSILILAAALAFGVVLGMSDKSSALSMALMVFGVCMALYGLFRLFSHSKEVVYLPTGSVTKEQNVYFDLKHLSRLTSMLEQGSFAESGSVKSDTSGNVRMDVLISNDKMFAAIQLFQFVPYNYTPVTSVYYFLNNDAASVSAFLSKCKIG